MNLVVTADLQPVGVMQVMQSTASTLQLPVLCGAFALTGRIVRSKIGGWTQACLT